ncbi:hypothetical protein MHO82_11545 [Vibrio sp. Of7-15]|uniref:DUF6896 domain-containing protein n=1 Tax=Vibrio sp. Of7-15 TaxID=2724879 RepID=UPI001EF2EA1B|nr:hypothetical protein [Vibrio sp. Of7-15]MCG7497499.1 hypothetical protein [Vibrio sp. Of7-15]
MNTELRKIISDFQDKVEEANVLLKKYLDTDEPHNWGPPIEQVGMLGGKYKYLFHGVGCKVEISKQDVVDFDYGPNGRIDGFDEWRLCGFVNARKSQYPNVQESHINLWFQEAVEAKEIEKSDSREYGNLYYLVANT